MIIILKIKSNCSDVHKQFIKNFSIVFAIGLRVIQIDEADDCKGARCDPALPIGYGNWPFSPDCHVISYLH